MQEQYEREAAVIDTPDKKERHRELFQGYFERCEVMCGRSIKDGGEVKTHPDTNTRLRFRVKEVMMN